MKKHLAAIVLLAFAVLVFTTPVSAATNPFMDVPLNHWSYDAIGQLAARGILSGYPDGTYKGRQPTTRYEMASAVARALAVVDITKASKHDVELLKRLIVEFKDELDALGVKVDTFDGRLGVIEERIRGWQISGIMAHDLDFWRADAGNGYFNLFKGRIFFDRWFGENDSIQFHARLRSENGGSGPGDEYNQLVEFQRFWVEFPFFFDTRMTVGRFNWDWEEAYQFYTNGISDLGVWSWLTDRSFIEGVGFSKSFRLGNFQMYAQRPMPTDDEPSAWELAAMVSLQPTEQVGVDFGVQAFLGDNASVYGASPAPIVKFDRLTTLFGGLRFDFNDNIGLRGIYYRQRLRADEVATGLGLGYNTHAYRVLLDVKQDMLGFTSLWLAYDFMKDGFISTSENDGSFDFYRTDGMRGDFDEMKTWRVGAVQQWNDQWRSWLYFGHHTLPESARGTQWGLGVEYMLNPNVGFALNYVRSSFNDRPHSPEPHDNHLLRFRTQVTF